MAGEGPWGTDDLQDEGTHAVQGGHKYGAQAATGTRHLYGDPHACWQADALQQSHNPGTLVTG